MVVKSLFHPDRYPALRLVVTDGGDAEMSLVDNVYDQILLQIVNGDLPGGAELKTTKLAESLEVSRTPVAQALVRLAADGLVSQHRNRRATVREAAENWLVDVHQLRQLVEPHAAARAAGNIDAEVLADLEMLAREARPNKEHAWVEAAAYFDSGLHLTIAEYCDNLPMRTTIRQCWSYKRVSYQAGNDTEQSLRRGFREHTAILEALKAGDSAGAKSAVAKHLDSASKTRPKSRIV